MGKNEKPGTMHRLKATLQQLFCEKRCCACASPFYFDGAGPSIADPSEDSSSTEARLLFCPECAARILKKDHPLCRLCGELLPRSHPPGLCGECSLASPPWDNLFLTGIYEDLLREMIVDFKFNGQLACGHALGRLLAGAIPAGHNYDALVPVPLHRERLSTRGFNQALELGRPVSAKHGLPLRPGWLERPVASIPQSGLDKKQRLENTKGIFKAPPDVRGKSILILDDILTTGSTLQSASTCLLKAGALRVGVAVVARTPPPAEGEKPARPSGPVPVMLEQI